jgi:cytochrome P450
VAASRTARFDPTEREFLENPYPTLNRLREGARVFYEEGRDRWFVTRHEDVRGCLRDKRLGRNFRHVMSAEEIGVPPLDPR